MLGLVGCSGGVRLDTNVFPSPKIQPERIFVVLNMPEAWSDNAKLFESTFSEKLRPCGTQTHVFFDPWKAEDLSLDDTEKVRRDRLINEEHSFNPDFVMNVKSVSMTSSATGIVNGVQFNLSLINWPSVNATMPWSGKAFVPSSGHLATDGGVTFASAIFSDLKKKGLLPKCPTTND